MAPLLRSCSSAAALLSLLLLLQISTTQAQRMGSPETTNSSSSTACADVHMIVVRASTEVPGQGVIGTLATMLSETESGSSVEAIDYPATLTPYAASVANGTIATTRQIMSYVESCPRGKLVLLGYSQGAHVIGDVMCGGGGPRINSYNPPLPQMFADKVVAMIQMGDPRFMAGKMFDMGSNKMVNGQFPRSLNISCDSMGSKILSFCDMGDPFCAGGADVNVHLTYTRRYNTMAHDFVTGKLREAGTTPNMAKGKNGAASTKASMLGIVIALVLALVMQAG